MRERGIRKMTSRVAIGKLFYLLHLLGRDGVGANYLELFIAIVHVCISIVKGLRGVYRVMRKIGFLLRYESGVWCAAKKLVLKPINIDNTNFRYVFS